MSVEPDRPAAARRRSAADLRRALETALDALKTDRVRTRSALVALAIAMAIVACLTTLVERGRAATIRSLESAGLNNLYLVQRPGGSRPLEARLTRAALRRFATLAGARSTLAIRATRAPAAAAGPLLSVAVYAVSAPLDRVLPVKAGAGRLLGDLDVERKSPYCVLGSDVARAAGLRKALGSLVTLGDRTYEVVGELAESRVESAATGDLPSLEWNRAVVVPMGAEPGAPAEDDTRYPIDVAVLSFSRMGEAERAAPLGVRIDSERFGASGPLRAVSPMQTLRQYRQARRTFDRIIWLVSLLTAASAVLGISNLLSASVIARTREIGLRRAVGARSMDIVLQFEAEGLLLGVLGGGAGLLAGAVISLTALDRSGGGASLSFLSFSALAAVCVLIGVLTGIRPSIRASRIDPAAALREG